MIAYWDRLTPLLGDGVETAFTVPRPFTPGTATVIRAGLPRLRDNPDEGWDESDAGLGIIRMHVPPLPGDVMLLHYLDTTPDPPSVPSGPPTSAVVYTAAVNSLLESQAVSAQVVNTRVSSRVSSNEISATVETEEVLSTVRRCV